MISTFRELYSALAPDRRLRLYVIILLMQVIIYTLLIYALLPLLEGGEYTLIESFYFVIMTITTVGYGIPFPLTNPATFTLVSIIIITGVPSVLMIIPVMITPYLASALRPSPPASFPFRLKNHVVIVGFDELARGLIESLMISNLKILVVEEDEDRARRIQQEYRKDDVGVIWGRYGDNATWTRAYVQDADAVVVCEDERTAAKVILGISSMTSARIIAVVDDLNFDRFLRYAGAEYVLSPKNITGRILARHAILRSDVDTIYEEIGGHVHSGSEEGRKGSLRLIKVPVPEGCRCVGRTIKELSLLERYGADILFFWRGGEFFLHPKGEDIINSTTMLFILGGSTTLQRIVEEEFSTTADGEEIAVIAGHGDVGKVAAHDLSSSGVRSIVVDPLITEETGVRGRAEEEEVLSAAHIEDADICIVAVNDDDVNIFTTLMARNLNQNLRILARANDPYSVDKLYRAGADYVALLPTLGGQVIAGIVLADIVQILLDLPHGWKVVMKHIMKNTPTTAGWIETKSGAVIVGIESTTRSLIRPAMEERLFEGDAVIAVGRTEELRRFINLL